MKLINTAISIVMLISLIQVVNAAGIGVAPSELVFSDALKGITYEKEFKIDNTGDNDIIAVIEIMEYKDWFTLEPGAEVRVPAKGSSKVKAKIDIPEDTAIGDYETMIYVKGKPADALEGMGLIPGAGFKAKITVTDKEIAEGYVDNILTRDTTLNNKVRFIVGFLNKGNVDVSPNAEITIKTEADEIVDSFEKQFDAVKAWASQSLIAEYDTEGKALGKYKADVSVYLNNELLKERTVYFKILEEMPSEIEESEEAEETRAVSQEETTNNVGILIVVVIVVAGLGAYHVFSKRKK